MLPMFPRTFVFCVHLIIFTQVDFYNFYIIMYNLYENTNKSFN